MFKPGGDVNTTDMGTAAGRDIDGYSGTPDAMGEGREVTGPDIGYIRGG
jgi:hypothetical protein